MLAMANDNDDLLAEIDRFLEETDMGPAAFGAKSVNNGHLVGRLRRGRDIGMSTGKQVRTFMTEYRARVAAARQSEGVAAE
jgi:hypothetical protein